MARHPLPDERWPTAAEAAASRLFSPLSLPCGLTLPDRTWVPAMVPWRATDEGFVTPEVLAWYERFARGRPGTLVVEATGIRDVPSGPLLRIGHDRFLPGLRELVATVARTSAGHTRLFIQVIDFLAIRRRPPPERYLGRFLALRDPHRQAAAAARPGLDPADDDAVRQALVALHAHDPEALAAILDERELEALDQGHRERVTDTQLPHVAELPRVLPGLFADAADRARRAGFHGVELHYAHAYTMASFLSRRNDRGDGYGGSPQARARLPLEVYRAVRERVGPELAVGCRMLGEEVIAGGSTLEDARAYAAAFARAGMDFLSVSRGGKFEDARQPAVGQAAYPYTGASGQACMPTVFGDAPPFGLNLPLAVGVRAAVHEAGCTTPVVASGGINGFHLAEDALTRGDADLVAAARQSLADPDWWAKLREGRGDAIQRCLYTNYCEALDQKHLPVTCQLWDRVARDAPETPLSADGRRRLVAPPDGWVAPARGGS
jgi:2,4-dienoyl-CoA reductase-like NADH-dependent reductase (Old Yellow Enzyme family)